MFGQLTGTLDGQVGQSVEVSVASIVVATGASRNTVITTLFCLLQAGLLVRQGAGSSVHHTKR